MAKTKELKEGSWGQGDNRFRQVWKPSAVRAAHLEQDVWWALMTERSEHNERVFLLLKATGSKSPLHSLGCERASGLLEC